MHESWQVDENSKSLGQKNKNTPEFPTTIMSNELCLLILTKIYCISNNYLCVKSRDLYPTIVCVWFSDQAYAGDACQDAVPDGQSPRKWPRWPCLTFIQRWTMCYGHLGYVWHTNIWHVAVWCVDLKSFLVSHYKLTTSEDEWPVVSTACWYGVSTRLVWDERMCHVQGNEPYVFSTSYKCM